MSATTAIGSSPPARISGLRKRYGAVDALRGIDLQVDRGEIVALLGPNGAGKTTAVDILLGLRAADEGSVELFGHPPTDRRARMKIGATPQLLDFPLTLKTSEVIALVQAHFESPADPDELLDRFALCHIWQRQTGGLSGGERRRLAVALAFCGDPSAVFLDEPTTGLDVDARDRVWDAIKAFGAAGGTVLFTTHYLVEAERLASRVVVLDHGRVRTSGTVEEVTSIVSIRQVRFKADQLPLDFPGDAEVQKDNGRVRVFTEDSDAYVAWLVRKGVQFSDLEVRPATLEEAFLQLTRPDQ